MGGRLARLRDRLARSGSPLGSRLLAVLSRDHLAEEDWDELEETLLLADVGAGPATELIEALRTRVRVLGVRDAGQRPGAAARGAGRARRPDASTGRWPPRRTRPTTASHVPAVVLVVGVNGTGKTTTVGKLARVLVAEGRTVVLGAADTFRAAAADQLETWGSRVGVPDGAVRPGRRRPGRRGVRRGAHAARRRGPTSCSSTPPGGCRTRPGSWTSSARSRASSRKEAPLSEVLLVLDATTGQNGLNQARVFGEVAGVTGIVLTKLDGTAKGGIVVAVQRELGVPVKLVGPRRGPRRPGPVRPGGVRRRSAGA